MWTAAWHASAVELFCSQQEAAQHLLAVVGVAVARETTQITAHVFEPASAQVEGCAVGVARVGESEEAQHVLELLLELLDYLRSLEAAGLQ